MKQALVSLILLLSACHFTRSTVNSVELVEYGTFRKLRVSDDMSAPKSTGGQVHAVFEVVLEERTTKIPAVVGTSFGVRIKLVGEPEGAIVPCTAKWLHPKYTNPATGSTSEVEEYPIYPQIGQAGYSGYTFDSDWEVVPGRWTIQIFVGSQLKIEQSFEVVATSGS